jgi:hypothetical protein
VTASHPPCPPPPAQIAAYVSLLGVDLAASFLLNYGGAEMYLPRDPDAASPVAALLGEAKARALGKAADRLPRRVPLAKPWLAGYLRSRGARVPDIARTLRVSDVAVRGYLRKLDEAAADRQRASDGRRF